MSTPKSQLEAVKTALASGSATQSTITALQSLLSAEANTKDTVKDLRAAQRMKGVAPAKPTAKPIKPNVRAAKKDQVVKVLDDEAPSLAPKERYALATDVVNITLKTLTAVLKARPSHASPTGHNANADAGTPKQQRALQARSVNATPTKQSPTKGKESRQTPVSRRVSALSPGTSPEITVTGECARLAFSFLRSVNTAKLGVREIPALQLENGMLALATKLHAHDLDSLATKELRILKKRIETFGKLKPAGQPEKETLASLLRLDLNLEVQKDVLPLAIAYQQIVLRVTATAKKPASIESSVDLLDLSTPTSPANLIARHGEISGDLGKTGKLLESLSSTILAMCPSNSPKADSLAVDAEVSPAPEACLRLQAIGLQIRKMWWNLVGHQPDLEKELFHPLSRCGLAFIRRSARLRSADATYNAAKVAVEALIQGYDDASSASLFTMYRALASLAETSSFPFEAASWATKMVDGTTGLDLSHAQRIAASVRQLCLPVSEDTCTTSLDAMIDGLKGKVTGSSADYECLMVELASALPALCSDTTAKSQNTGRVAKLIELSASFSQRFVRSYPGRGLAEAQTILQSALRHNSQSDDNLSWLTTDSAKVFVDAGTLKAVTYEAMSLPSERVWSTSTGALTLARILRLLTIRAIKSASEPNPNSIYDDESLSSLERGLVLELQLRTMLKLASRTKYHGNISKLLPEITRRLHVVHSASSHPVRRAFIASEMLRFREAHPALLPPHRLQVWLATDLNSENLCQDEGLRDYVPDVTNLMELTRMFHKGSPSIALLQPLLTAWERAPDFADGRAIEKAIYDPTSLAVMLRAVATFFGALGEESTRLSVQTLLVRLNQAPSADTDDKIEASLWLARQWQSLGYSEKSGTVLAEAQKLLHQGTSSTLSQIQYGLAHAEYLLDIDNLNECESTLSQVRELRDILQPKDVPRDQRSTYERIHAEAWLVQSRLSVAKGAPADALAAAKHAVKILNSTWHRLEKCTTGESSSLEASDESADTEVNGMASGVSKLKLSPANKSDESKQPELKGAAFWPLIPLLCKALIHLSDMYAHHGLFSESNYYSTKSIEIAESAGSKILLSRARSHRARLLVLAGKTEDAEICLSVDDDAGIADWSLARVERIEAQATLRANEGSLEEAQKLYKRAQEMLREMQSEEYISRLGRFEPKSLDLASQMDAMTLNSGDNSKAIASTAKGSRSKAVTKAKAPAPRKGKTMAAKTSSKTRAVATRVSAQATKPTCYLLDKRRMNILVNAALATHGTDTTSQEGLQLAEDMKRNTRELLKRRRLQYHDLMLKANATLETDFTYNILPESTLAFPALHRTFEEAEPTPPSNPASSGRAAAKAVVRKVEAEPGFGCVLQEARGYLLSGFATSKNFSGVAEIHTEAALLASVSMLLSSSDSAVAKQSLQSTSVGLAVDWSRMNAAEHEQNASAVDTRHDDKSSPFQWPSNTATSPGPMPTASHFQTTYINILPKPWTAVSLTLSPDLSEIYIARYRSQHPPFILRIPFSRHKPEELGEETFDYTAGKAELADIIQLSNYSCHNNGDMASKGAKSNWWTEREALDRRLQELLINVEEIWFGGFRGILSPRQRRVELLARFRKSFEGILDRHLPSRQVAKGKAKKLALNNDVLELLVNLGNDNDRTIDLDEPVADLLYFVVDMLQFNGERNAYDEVDFDGMAVEVLDALRAYHDACDEDDVVDQHLVLVLDKRLQAFPWENLPYLEGVSVSRVGSMHSLRECILAMRARQGEWKAERHAVSRKSGTFILNPSADLANTQAVLEPALTKLAAAENARWSSIVQRAPSEDEFKASLERSSMLLYFGHGAGSQYIRPRTVKKLNQCSEVVWLMGCSSGAVTEYGELEPQAVPLAYLMAGGASDSLSSADDSDTGLEKKSKCMAVLATLWDVTDKDIDRFSLTVGEEWGLWPSSTEQPTRLPAKTPKKRDRMLAPATPPQVPKTPKTTKAKKTPAPAKTPARNRSRPRGESWRQMSLVEAVARSRESCYLRYLNGAAPVVYGVPVYLGD